MGSHRFFDHTGDYGAHLSAEDEADLYETGVDALIALMVEDVAAIEEREEREVEARGVDEAELLVALGNEVLFLFETGFVTRVLEVTSLEDGVVRAVARGEPFDSVRHPVARPIKAVTHHRAYAAEDADGAWTGRLIFDL